MCVGIGDDNDNVGVVGSERRVRMREKSEKERQFIVRARNMSAL